MHGPYKLGPRHAVDDKMKWQWARIVMYRNSDRVNNNVFLKFGENLLICSQDIEQKRNSGVNKGYNSGIGECRMTTINVTIPT